MHDHRLKDILPFVASVECGSFTAAAERLHVTGSAISKSVSRLETRLGSRLLERTTRSLHLTDAGSAYYQTCLRILEDLAEAEAVLAAQRTIPSGRLRLAVPTTYGRLNVMPLLMPFCQQHPELALSLSFSDRFVDLFEEGVDVAVRIGGAPDLPASLGWRNMGREQMQFCASPAYLDREGRPENEAALLNHPASFMSAWMARPNPGCSPPKMVSRTGARCRTGWHWATLMPSCRLSSPGWAWHKCPRG